MQQNPIQPSSWYSLPSYWTDACWLLVILLIFYGAGLGSYPLFIPDEGRYNDVARIMWETRDFITPRVNGLVFLDKPILYYWWQVLSISIFGLHEAAMRFFPMVFGILTCLLTYVFGRDVFDRQTGILAALILAVSPLHFAMAHYANLDLEIAFWITVTLYLLWWSETKEAGARYFYAASVTAGLGVLTKGLIGMVLPGLVWLSLTIYQKCLPRYFKIKPLITASILFSAIVLPWMIAVQSANPAFFEYFVVEQQFKRFISSATFNNVKPLWFYVPVILLAFFPWCFFLPQTLYAAWKDLRRGTFIINSSLIPFLFGWFLFIIVFFSIPQAKIVSYVLPALPPMALLLARYVTTHAITFKRYLVVMLLLMGSAWLAAGFFGVSMVPEMGSSSALLVLVPCVLWCVCMGFMRASFLRDITLMLLASMLLLWWLVAMMPCWHIRSTKDVGQFLRSIIEPQDQVIAYNDYFHDIPIYLGRNVQVMAAWDAPHLMKTDNWRREFALSRTFQDTRDLLLDRREFLRAWNSHKRVYAFVDPADYESFTKSVTQFEYVASNRNAILMRNH